MQMATSNKALNEAIRKEFMEVVRKALEANGEQVLVTGSNEFAIPTLDAERNEKYLVLTFKVPTGSRDGDAYDGEAVAQDYARKVEEDKAKAEAAAKKKAAKIAKDKAAREAKKAEAEKAE